jgi:hypothetical protein
VLFERNAFCQSPTQPLSRRRPAVSRNCSAIIREEEQLIPCPTGGGLARRVALRRASIPGVTPPVRYTRSGDANIAYQVIGDGPTDLLFTIGSYSNLDVLWESPNWTRMFERLSRFTRFVLFAGRGRQRTGAPHGVLRRRGYDRVLGRHTPESADCRHCWDGKRRCRRFGARPGCGDRAGEGHTQSGDLLHADSGRIA